MYGTKNITNEIVILGNTGEGVVTSDSEYDEDEAEEKEAELLQQRQLERMQEEDFMDTFIIQQNKETKVSQLSGGKGLQNLGLIILSSALILNLKSDLISAKDTLFFLIIKSDLYGDLNP